MRNILQLSMSQSWDKPKLLVVKNELQQRDPGVGLGIFPFFLKQTKQLKVCVNLFK